MAGFIFACTDNQARMELPACNDERIHIFHCNKSAGKNGLLRGVRWTRIVALTHRRGFNRMRLLVEFVDLLLVFCFNHTAFELKSGRNLARSYRELVWYHNDFFYGLKLRKTFIQVFNNSFIEVAYFV